MNKYFLFLFLFANTLFALNINSFYYIKSNNVKLRDIVPNAKYDLTLYKIEDEKYTKKVKSKDLINLLASHEIKNVQIKSRYVKFIKKSSVDLSQIKSYIEDMYRQKYKQISIHSIIVTPKKYLLKLPKKFSIFSGKKAHLFHKNILSIKTLDNKKLYFDYIVDANIDVYVAKESMQKGTVISSLNLKQKNIRFDKFRSLPIDSTHLNALQLKSNIRNGRIVLQKDVVKLNLVKKGTNVQVTLKEKNLNISFLAVALQNGKLNDIITVQKKNKQKIKVTVIGKNRVEIK